YYKCSSVDLAAYHDVMDLLRSLLPVEYRYVVLRLPGGSRESGGNSQNLVILRLDHSQMTDELSRSEERRAVLVGPCLTLWRRAGTECRFGQIQHFIGNLPRQVVRKPLRRRS